MPVEIERKFIVNVDLLPKDLDGVAIRQGYIFSDEQKTIRVRVMGHKAFITIKGKDLNGTRPEFEYNIPFEDGVELFESFTEYGKISKIRYHLLHGRHLWEIDQFLDDNLGLWMAEIELQHAEEEIIIPPWVAKEVTGNPMYLNAYLATHPFTSWVAQ
jgi:CYTH domain-containing protein